MALISENPGFSGRLNKGKIYLFYMSASDGLKSMRFSSGDFRRRAEAFRAGEGGGRGSRV
jgi:hypothetical protein